MPSDTSSILTQMLAGQARAPLAAQAWQHAQQRGRRQLTLPAWQPGAVLGAGIDNALQLELRQLARLNHFSRQGRPQGVVGRGQGDGAQ